MFLLAVYNELKRADMGNAAGVFFIGVCLGAAVFFGFYKKFNPDFRSAEGVLFLTVPFALFLLTSIKSEFIVINFNSNFFWIVFLFIYLFAGAVLYIKNNPELSDKTELFIVSVCVPFLILSLVLNFANGGSVYSPDSYGYYDMSRSIFGDFGYVNVTRQYVKFTDYGISFPYLFPALIAVFNFFTGFGMLSGTCINIIAALVSLRCILKISSRLTASAVPGLIVSAALFFNPDYLSEAVKARAVPLSLLCALLTLNIILRKGKPGKKELFIAGLFAGAGMVVRFDFFVISALLGTALIFVYKKKMFEFVPFYCFGLLIFTSPWIVYSIVRFQRFWISDNSGTLLLITPQLPQRFFTPDETVPDIFSDPKNWFLSHQYIIMRGFAGFFSIITRPVELCMLLGTTAMGLLSKIAGPGGDKKPAGNFKILFILAISIYAAKTMAVILVGYADLRYHTEAVIILFLMILCAVYISLRDHRAWIYFIVLIFSVSVINNLQPLFKDSMPPRLLNSFIDTAAITPDAETKEIENLLEQSSGIKNAAGVRLFCIDSNYYNAYPLGAYTEIKTYARISNISEERLIYLMKYYIKPDYIYFPETERQWTHIIKDHYIINMLSEKPPLYEITPLEPTDKNSIRLSDVSDRNWDRGVGVHLKLLLVRNTDENRVKLENAAGLEVDGIYAAVEDVYESSETWIHVRVRGNIDPEIFAYPNIIQIKK